MLFGVWTQVCPRNHIICGGLDPQGERAIFSGVGVGTSWPVVKYRESLA